ncbi:MAG: type II toxin-antitoxin system RelE/ParE family toxin [Clostridiales Family XIII bacterium]|jgi:plasmid stabilization system protein ParE|nr:type II toxin-antitoxin system RelE/ParE family toxin [Clostridiales Family XIII bacterium]
MPKYTLSYLDAAKEEYFDALLYYKEKSINAAVSFESAMETLEEMLAMWPHIGKQIEGYDDVFSLVVPKYPYLLCFRVSDYDLEIVAICLFNTYRDPKRLHKLIDSRINYLDTQH